MANTNGGRINFQVGYNVDQNSVNQVKKSLQDLQSIKFSNFEGTQRQFLDISCVEIPFRFEAIEKPLLI